MSIIIERPGLPHVLLPIDHMSTPDMGATHIYIETMAAAIAAHRRFAARNAPFKAYGCFGPNEAGVHTLVLADDDTAARLHDRIAALRDAMTKAGLEIPDYMQPVTS